jgi:hypothetical protein
MRGSCEDGSSWEARVFELWLEHGMGSGRAVSQLYTSFEFKLLKKFIELIGSILSISICILKLIQR